MERRQQDTFQRDVLTTLGDIKALVAGQAASQAAQHERIEAIERSNVRQWWFSAAILPITGLLHAISKRLGI
jgi:hypothetical protein